jgi:hypothetical protein
VLWKGTQRIATPRDLAPGQGNRYDESELIRYNEHAPREDLARMIGNAPKGGEAASEVASQGLPRSRGLGGCQIAV